MLIRLGKQTGPGQHSSAQHSTSKTGSQGRGVMRCDVRLRLRWEAGGVLSGSGSGEDERERGAAGATVSTDGRLRYHYYTDCSRTKREGGGAEEPYNVKAQHDEMPHRGPGRRLKRGDGPRVDRFEEDSRGLV